jgi:hypothetical protein
MKVQKNARPWRRPLTVGSAPGGVSSARKKIGPAAPTASRTLDGV